MADLPTPPGAGAFGNVGATITKKVGPLPLWAYAAIAGGAALVWKLKTGGGGKAGIEIPYAGPLATGGGAGDASGGGGGGGSPTPVAGTNSDQPPGASAGVADVVLPVPVKPAYTPADVPISPIGRVTAPAVVVPNDAPRVVTSPSGISYTSPERDPVSLATTGIINAGFPLTDYVADYLKHAAPNATIVGAPSQNTSSTPAAPVSEANVSQPSDTAPVSAATTGEISAPAGGFSAGVADYLANAAPNAVLVP